MDCCEDINVIYQFGDVDLKTFILDITEECCLKKIKALEEYHSRDSHFIEKSL